MGGRADEIWRIAGELKAHALGRRGPAVKGLPPLLAFTEPDRGLQPLVLAQRLPPGAGLVLRLFGADDALETARDVAAICRARGVALLMGEDAGLAEACGAEGLHLPQRRVADAPACRQAHPQWIITSAAHDEMGARMAGAAEVDAVVLSPVFPTRSASGRPPLGAAGFERLAELAGVPAYALGGISADNAAELAQTSAAGLAAIDAVSDWLGRE